MNALPAARQAILILARTLSVSRSSGHGSISDLVRTHTVPGRDISVGGNAMNKFVAVLALSVVISGAVLADVEKTKPLAGTDTFSALDRNADHRLSRSEASYDRTLSVIFAEIDTDADGFLTPLEYAAVEQRRTMTSKR
jgi:hypothetical protein